MQWGYNWYSKKHAKWKSIVFAIVILIIFSPFFDFCRFSQPCPSPSFPLALTFPLTNCIIHICSFYINFQFSLNQQCIHWILSSMCLFVCMCFRFVIFEIFIWASIGYFWIKCVSTKMYLMCWLYALSFSLLLSVWFVLSFSECSRVIISHQLCDCVFFVRFLLLYGVWA